jgi:hypothetical protein
MFGHVSDGTTMTTLIVGNSRTEEMVGDLAALTSVERQVGGCSAQRVLWFAHDGDVLVLPWLPSDAYLDYVTALTGTDRDSLRMVVPPPGVLGPDILTPDRLADEGFHAQLRTAIRDRSVHNALAVYKDLSVVELVRARLCESYRVLGYRGNLSADAILTVDGEILFTEANGRLTGSTHLYAAIGARVLAPGFLQRRVLIERADWWVPSLPVAVDRLAAAGLAYDRVSGTGVVIVSDQLPDGTVVYCVIGEDLESARVCERRVADLFTAVPR